jgi:DNA polymerase-3 subunit alpha
VNASESDFSVEPVHGGEADGALSAIRFGLAAVKGVGTGAADAIVAARGERDDPFGSLADLCEAVDHHVLGKTSLEALTKGGALDGLGGHRAQLHAALDGSLRAAAAVQEDKKAGQMSLFGGGGSSAPEPPPEASLPTVPRWAEKEVLLHEKEALGIYMSSHPLARHERTLTSLATHRTDQLAASGTGVKVLVGGMVGSVKTMYPKSGRNKTRKMARFKIEDFQGSVGCVMFSDAFERDGELLVDEAIGFVEATVDLSREEPDLKVDRFVPVDDAFEELASRLVLRPRPGSEAEALPLIGSLISRFPGKGRVLVEMSPTPGIRAVYQVDNGGIEPSRAIHEAAVEALGADAVRWQPRKLGSGKSGNGRRSH